jgi:hypothetical protein
MDPRVQFQEQKVQSEGLANGVIVELGVKSQRGVWEKERK